VADYVLSTRPAGVRRTADPLRSGPDPAFLVHHDAPFLNSDTALAEPRPTPRALPMAGGPEDDEATRPAPLADIHIDVPDEGAPEGVDTLVELPLDDDARDTIRMPL